METGSGDLGDLQVAVMKILWEFGAATVREVVAALPDDLSRAYTTILTVLRSLEKRGLVRHDATDGARMYRYSPLVTEGEIRDRAIHDLLDRHFNGSPEELLRYIQEAGICPAPRPGSMTDTRIR